MTFSQGKLSGSWFMTVKATEKHPPPKPTPLALTLCPGRSLHFDSFQPFVPAAILNRSEILQPWSVTCSRFYYVEPRSCDLTSDLYGNHKLI